MSITLPKNRQGARAPGCEQRGPERSILGISRQPDTLNASPSAAPPAAALAGDQIFLTHFSTRRGLGYSGLAEAIIEGQLSPWAAADMLRRHGAGKDGMVVAIILLAASTARWRAQHDGWNGETERLLALEALHNDAAFKRAASRAAKIVAEHWQEITANP